jgi:hypothetical protein
MMNRYDTADVMDTNTICFYGQYTRIILPYNTVYVRTRARRVLLTYTIYNTLLFLGLLSVSIIKFLPLVLVVPLAEQFLRTEITDIHTVFGTTSNSVPRCTTFCTVK